MQVHADRVHLSPTDLVNFLGCAHCTVLDRYQLNSSPLPRTFSDSDRLLAQKGKEHEQAYLDRLRADGVKVATISREDDVDPAELTLETMRAGAEVIYQASLRAGRWNGVADFLLKTDRPSDLGRFGYEAVDTKLARHPDPAHVIQLGVYSDLLRQTQGSEPDGFRMVLGTNEEVAFRARDFAAYVGQARRRIELFVDSPPVDSYPRPCNHCARCHWREQCEQQWEQDDRLNLVANATRSQVEKLERAGITTLAELAKTPAGTVVPDLNPAVFDRLHAQAALQLHKRQTGKNRVELIPAEAERGFARLPSPDPGDLFFDMEGDPLYSNGLEYLFGVCYQAEGELRFRPYWAHDHDEEQNAFCAFMQFLAEHLEAHPGAFVYHYNHYEPTALKRLSARYATAEHQLADLLRGRKFVDLYKVVREAIRVSEPSYSLKNLETFYMAKRDGDVATAGDSIVVYNRWRDKNDAKLLHDIERYNEFDCRSTAALRNWLLNLRPKDGPWFAPKATAADDDEAEERKRKRTDREAEDADYQNRLQKLGDATPAEWPGRLADLLGFHAREANPEWWAFFDRMDKLPDELLDDAECLAGLEQAAAPVPEKKSFLYTFRFPSQETKLRAGKDVVNVATGKRAGKIHELDESSCSVKLKLGIKSGSLPATLSIGPEGPLETNAQRDALRRIARSVLDGDDRYAAVQQLLDKKSPRINQRREGQPIISGDDVLAGTTEAVVGLDRSYLFIQGPPGTGKTYTSAYVIVELLRRGNKVGVAANSHKAIHNLLDEVEKLAVAAGVTFAGIKKSSNNDADSEYPGQFIRSESDGKKIDPTGVDLLAGTAWLFADERFDQSVDYLFIDEAGQVALANVVAMATSARNIVLVGDQMQLGQPTKGVHPRESGLSVLDFLLGGQPTVAPDRGVFLSETRRLRPEVCHYVSDAFYDGRLKWHSITAKRRLIFSQDLGIHASGIHFVGIDHCGNSQRSVEEGEAISTYYLKVLDQQFEDENGERRVLSVNDILVVSPYNVQVNYLKSILPDGARVGTVDKFQGQEAPVVFLSMASSSAADMPRDIGFLFSANRLKVAVSRAQCLAVVVASPRLLATPCATVDDLRLVNKFCQIADQRPIRRA
jgi:uncharacterized protein